MNKPNIFVVAPPSVKSAAHHPRPSLHPVWLALSAVVAGFALPLYRLAAFALGSGLYSYIVLIPFISAYLVWQKRRALPRPTPPARGLAAVLLAGGAATLAGLAFARTTGVNLAPEDRLALTTTAFLLTATGVTAWFCGRSVLNTRLFPIGFLFFAVPVPSGAMAAIDRLMQHGSAAVARGLFDLFGTAVFYQDLSFQLPGINLYVAPECSGIRSTIALTIVSVLTGYIFLRSPARRALLTAAVVPLALLRNGFRIFTIGELCVNLGPQMIDSPVHHRGGPVFFALSLIPFFLLVYLLRRRERTAPPAADRLVCADHFRVRPQGGSISTGGAGWRDSPHAKSL